MNSIQRKTLVVVMLIGVSLPAFAQHQDSKKHEHKRAEITELVSDLSASQKRKVESIGKESRERVDSLRVQKQSVRAAIEHYMNLEGDQSESLFPLFDKEAALQSAISREMYDAKRRIDEVLTPEQRTQLRSACSKKDDQPRRPIKAGKPELQQKYKKH